jgi:TolB protein
MMRSTVAGLLMAAVFLLALDGVLAAAATPSNPLGVFDGQSDVGSVSPPGTARFDAATGTYLLDSAGANTWYHIDGFHYLWKKTSGDLTLTADVAFPSHTYAHEPNPHRKGILMIRQSLDAGGAYIGIGVHGSGLTALQFRRERGANTEGIELNIEAPKTVRLEKRGDTFTLLLSMHGEPLHPAGASATLRFKEPFFVGLGALSHDVDTTDRVVFSQVSLQPLSSPPNEARSTTFSSLIDIQIEDQFRRAVVIRSLPTLLQSADWIPGSRSIYVHESGHVIRVPLLDPLAGGTPQDVATPGLVGCAANYGLSFDGQWLAMSCAPAKGEQHEVFVLPAGGGAPRQLTHGTAPSYFHAWSFDSATIAFTRGRASKADIFLVAAAGGAETRLTRDSLNDGPDFTPDGKFMYFDSMRSGSLQIWRMHTDGSGAEQITDDDNVNSSPHVAPDGKTLVFLSQAPGSGDAIGPAAIKAMAFDDGLIRTVANVQGNRNSFSMYPWGDSHHLAFISYQSRGDAP